MRNVIAPAKTKHKTTRAAIYTRKSVTEGLDQDFNTLDAQREAGEAYITSQKSEGWVCLPDRYDDGGFSGGTLDRPALNRLVDDIKAGEVDCVVVYKVDRLSRSLLDFSRLVEVFDKHDVSFVSVTQPINTADSTGRLMLNILLSFAQFERETIADRTRDKMSAARRKGKWTGGVPLLGYDVHPNGGKLVVNKDEAPIVREIFALYLKHQSLQKVVAELDARGWRTKSWTLKDGRVRDGKPFTKTTLSRFLTNPIFAGLVNHKGQTYPGEHRGVIRKATFEKVQAILAENLNTGPAKTQNKYGFLLKGILRCGACDAAYIPSTTRKGSKVYRYYVCTSAQRKGYKTCPKPSFSAHEIEAWVVDQIRAIGKDPKLQAEVLKQATQQVREHRTVLDAEAKLLRTNREKTQTEINGLLKALAGGTGAGPSITGRLAELEDEATSLATRLAEIDREREGLAQSEIDPADLKSALELFDPVWDVLFPGEQARVIQVLARRIVIDPEVGEPAFDLHPTGIHQIANEGQNAPI